MNISVAMTFAEGGMVMAYWKAQEKKISIFEQTILLCESNPALLDKVMRARENSVLYPAQEGKEGQWKREQRVTDIVVTEHRTLEAVRNWKMQYPDSRVGVLNFAAPMHPGGDVIRGSDTQEAGICRCSTLYPCLHTERWMQQYYGENRRMPEAGYGNSCIYIPDVLHLYIGHAGAIYPAHCIYRSVTEGVLIRRLKCLFSIIPCDLFVILKQRNYLCRNKDKQISI